MYIYDGTRLSRKGDSFDHRFDDKVAPCVLKYGFHENEPYCYRRSVSQGEDVIYFNVTYRDVTVFVSHRPESMQAVDEAYEPGYVPGEPRIGLGSVLRARVIIT